MMLLAVMSVIAAVRIVSSIIGMGEHNAVVVTRSTELLLDTESNRISTQHQAIRTTINNTNPHMEFEMFLFPESVDKVITRKLQQRPITYERDVTLFLRYIFHEYANLQYQKETFVDSHNNNDNRAWAVDVGANVGYHTLYMASLGASVIALEPAPDTYELLRGSLALNPSFSDHVTVIPAGASDSHSHGRLTRHADSPGMTTLVATGGLPWEFHAVVDEGTISSGEAGPTTSSSSSASSTSPVRTPSTSEIPLLPIEEILTKYGLPEKENRQSVGTGMSHHHPGEQLWIAKVDCEGWELHAFRGLNLGKYPFRYLLFEFFPQLIEAGGSDPLELLQYVLSFGYQCIYKWVDDGMAFSKSSTIGDSPEQLQQWIGTIRSHVNIFCRLESKI